MRACDHNRDLDDDNSLRRRRAGQRATPDTSESDQDRCSSVEGRAIAALDTASLSWCFSALTTVCARRDRTDELPTTATASTPENHAEEILRPI